MSMWKFKSSWVAVVSECVSLCLGGSAPLFVCMCFYIVLRGRTCVCVCVPMCVPAYKASFR